LDKTKECSCYSPFDAHSFLKPCYEKFFTVCVGDYPHEVTEMQMKTESTIANKFQDSVNPTIYLTGNEASHVSKAYVCRVKLIKPANNLFDCNFTEPNITQLCGYKSKSTTLS